MWRLINEFSKSLFIWYVVWYFDTICTILVYPFFQIGYKIHIDDAIFWRGCNIAYPLFQEYATYEFAINLFNI